MAQINKTDWIAESYKLDKLKERTDRAKKRLHEHSSGMLVEKLLLSSFDLLTIKQLEDIRYILNQEIKKKKIMKRINRGGGGE